ncbi:909_t:CDS:2, partial [Scutellospora calospora]
ELLQKQLVVSLQQEDNGKSMDQLLILRAVSNGKGKKRFVETWKLGALVNILDVTDIHGEFYTDGDFGGLYWSKDEQKAVYIAEQKELDDSDDRKFDYIQSYGERFSNKCIPLIVVFNVSTNEAKVLPKFDKIDPGQVQFGSEDKSLILIGYYNEPRRFGIAACINRVTGIYQCQLDGSNLEHLSNYVEHARSRLNLSGNSLSNFSSRKNCLIVPIVRFPSLSFHNNFPGIYRENIPLKAFITID